VANRIDSEERSVRLKGAFQRGDLKQSIDYQNISALPADRSAFLPKSSTRNGSGRSAVRPSPKDRFEGLQQGVFGLAPANDDLGMLKRCVRESRRLPSTQAFQAKAETRS
jgi:hypothetical protein